MLKMKLISLLKNPKIRISLIILTAIVTIVSIIAWPKSKANENIEVAFRATSMGVYAGNRSIDIPELGPNQANQGEKAAKYTNIYCIDEGTPLGYETYYTEMDLYNAAESSRYFRNYNSMLWLVDNMYIGTAQNSAESWDYISSLVTAPEVKANVTAYGDITPDQIKSLNRIVGSGVDTYGNSINRNLIEIVEQLVIWNYTDNAGSRDFDSLVEAGFSGAGITETDQNICKYLYFGLKYLANQNSNYTSNGVTANVVTLDANAQIDAENHRVGPYYLKSNGVTLNPTNIKSKISATITDDAGNSVAVSADKIIVNSDGSIYIDTTDLANVVKSTINVNGIYSGSNTTAKVIVNGRDQNLMNVQKTVSSTNLSDTKERQIIYSGKYSVKLVKTKKDGVTPITQNPAVFTVAGAVDKARVQTNNEGIIEIVNEKEITSADATDIYAIVEDAAPKGYQKYNGTISLDVKFKTSGTNIVVDKENTTLNSNGTNGTVKFDYENDSTIRIYVPNIQDEDVEIHKGVKEIYNRDSGYNKDEVQEWVIQTKIPEQIGSFKKFVITDTIDDRLVFSGVENIKVSVVNGKELKNNEDYKVKYESGIKTFKVSFIEGDFKSAALKAGDIIEIRFNTTFKLDENGRIIALNQSVPNEAKLTYTNADGKEKESITERPEVHVGGVGLFKYDDRNQNGKHDDGEPALEGAHFKIAESEEKAKKGEFIKDASGKDLEVVSNKDGLAVFEGLEFGEDAMDQEKYKTSETVFGENVYAYDWTDTKNVKTTYYIVETVSPEGYSKIEEPISAEVKKDNYEIKDIGSLVQVGNVSNVYDLSLRKFITKLDDQDITNRVPEVDLAELVAGNSTTAAYNHTKEPVLVANNQIVTYTIRVYNEGPQAAYASLVRDNMPEGLEFVTYTKGDGSINDIYGWKLVDENGKEVSDSSKAAYAITDYLGKDDEENNLIKAFYPETMNELDYRDLLIQFRVIEPNTSDRILTNKAEIVEETNKEGKVVTDRDSVAGVWNEGEDDQDVEHVKVLYFDLALRKWVTEAIVTENGKTQVYKTGHKAEDDPEDVVKVDLKKSRINDVTVKFKYSIRVTNQGEIPGEALEVSEYIPDGLKFIPEDNPDWKVVDGQIVTEKLANTTLQPGESAEVEFILTWINDANNMGVKTNVAEISKDHNAYGAKDIDSTPGNKVSGEDDIDDAPVMLTVKTGSQVISYAVVALAFTAILGAGVITIKKFVK